jgi:hypothetical protein
MVQIRKRLSPCAISGKQRQDCHQRRPNEWIPGNCFHGLSKKAGHDAAMNCVNWGDAVIVDDNGVNATISFGGAHINPSITLKNRSIRRADLLRYYPTIFHCEYFIRHF